MGKMSDGGPAFPRPYSERRDEHGMYWDGAVAGMSLRQWYAGQALIGVIGLVCTVQEMARGTGIDATSLLDEGKIAKASYEVADAMLKEGEKE